MKKFLMLAMVAGIMAITVGAYAATLGGTPSAEVLGSTGDITVNAPGAGDIGVSFVLDTNNSSSHFGKVTGANLSLQNAPGAGVTWDVLLRVEDDDGSLLGGGTSSVSGSDTSASISFGDELDPKDIVNAIVVIDQG